MKSKGKSLVISGFILLVVLMITGLWTIYRNLEKFSDKMLSDDDKRELLVVGNIINNLYETEGVYNLMVYESAEKYIDNYDSIRPLISSRIDTLRQLTTNRERVLMLDSIDQLLDHKSKNLIDIRVLMDSVRKGPSIIRETSSSYISPTLNRSIGDFLKERNLGPEEEMDEVVDTTIVRGERKSLFKRLGDAIAGKQDSTVILQNRQSVVVQKEFELIVDTVINMVKYSERLDLERQKNFQTALLQRQSAMNQTNLVLTNKIDKLLKTIEKEELENTLRLINERDFVLGSSHKTISRLSVGAFLIAFFFALLFVLDFNKVQRTKRELEKSNKRINQLLKSREKLMLAVSHDIKSPMGSILGYLELMESDVGVENAKVYRSNMKKSGEHILELVNSLLDLHKIESGTWTQNNTRFDVTNVADVTVNSFNPVAEQKNLKLTFDNQLPENLTAYGEPFMIRLILSNLISNAVKYTHKGSIKVKASFDKTSEKLFFTVNDTGIGIDEKHQNLIFEEFAQIKSDSPNEYIKGSGLGLAITKGLIDQLNGHISVKSEINKGSEFTVELPMAVADADSNINNVENKSSEAYSITNKSALVIDDDPIQLTMVAEMLKRKGVVATTESDSNRVLDILKSKSFDIIFIDIQMPQKNGFVLATEIVNSKLISQGHTPLIAVTAHTNITLQEFKNAGFDSFLTKPFEANQLYDVINEHLKTKFKADKPKSDIYGVQALIKVIKDDKESCVQILRSFISESNPLIDELSKLGVGDYNNTNAPSYAHKMLPLYKMIGDDELVTILEKIDKKKSVSKLDLESAEHSIVNHIRSAEKIIDSML